MLSLLLLLAFQTGPVDPDLDVIRVAVVGDNQNGPTTFGTICQSIAVDAPHVFVGVGDHVQNGLASEWISQWQTPLTPIASVPRMGAIGNHDDVPGYVANVWPSVQHPLTHPVYGNAVALWAAVTVGNVRFVFLDTNEHPTIRISLEAGGAQRVWLEQEIASAAWTTARWRVVAYHHPHKTEHWDAGCYYPAQPERDYLVALLLTSGAHLILNGHAHAFQRGALASPTPAWVITGGGGGFLDTTQCWNWSEITVHQAIFHYMLLTFSPSILVVQAKDTGGSVFDSVTIL